jgi:hypothetical protein
MPQWGLSMSMEKVPAQEWMRHVPDKAWLCQGTGAAVAPRDADL